MTAVEETALGNHKAAIAALGELIKAHPDSPYPLLDSGNDLVAQGEYSLAIAKYEQAEKHSGAQAYAPIDAEVRAKLAYALYSVGNKAMDVKESVSNYQRAVTELQHAIALRQVAQDHNDLANVIREWRIRIGPAPVGRGGADACKTSSPYPQFTDAISEHREALSLLGGDKGTELSNVHLDLGKTFRACDDRAQAEKELLGAVAANYGNAYAHEEQGLLFDDEGRHAQAALELALAIQTGLAGRKQCDELRTAMSSTKEEGALPKDADLTLKFTLSQCQ